MNFRTLYGILEIKSDKLLCPDPSMDQSGYAKKYFEVFAVGASGFQWFVQIDVRLMGLMSLTRFKKNYCSEGLFELPCTTQTSKHIKQQQLCRIGTFFSLNSKLEMSIPLSSCSNESIHWSELKSYSSLYKSYSSPALTFFLEKKT